MNAAGSLGFAPDLHSEVSLQTFGAFVTNPISLRARNVARGPRLFSFPGGVLIHTGHPNPGLRNAIKEYAAAWRHAPVPIILHLLSAEPKQLRAAMPRIEELENVIAVELSFEAGKPIAEMSLAIAAASGELPLIAQLPLHNAIASADSAMQAGASAISLGPPRGAMPGPDEKLVTGRLYGPALYPQALAVAAELAQQGIAVIAAGGVETRDQGEPFLAAGAIAVQMDIGLWK